MTLGLTAILALGAFLRLWQAGESLWIDELHTSWVVSGKLSEVLPRAAMGNQSPLYFWGMWLLVQVTGQSEWTLRLPSLLAGIALPAAVYFLVGRSFRAVQDNPDGPEGPSYFAALAAALLVAIDPTCIFYAQEARPYAWVMLLAVVELVLLRRLIENPTLPWRLALLANSLVLFYLHYTTAIFLAGIVALLPMLVRLTRSPYPTRHLVIDLLLAAALAAPGVVQMSDIFERRTNWEAFVDEPSWLALFTAIPFAGWAMLGAGVVALALLVPRVLPGHARTRGSASAAPPVTSPPPSVLWYCVLLAAILLPLILSWTVTALDAARIYHVRYLVALVPLAAAATCLASAWIPWRIVQTTALIALAGWHLYDGRMLDQFARDGRILAVRNEDWRGAAEYLNRRLENPRPFFVDLDPCLIEGRDPLWGWGDLEDYGLFPLRGLYYLDAEKLQLARTWPGLMREFEAFQTQDSFENREVWYIIRGGTQEVQDRLKATEEWLNLNRRIRIRPAEWKSFGKVQLICVKRDEVNQL